MNRPTQEEIYNTYLESTKYVCNCIDKVECNYCNQDKEEEA